MSAFLTLDALRDVMGKIVLIRADLNVPLSDGMVTDCTRISRFVPTVVDLAGQGARVLIMSHLGRPKGRPVPAMSLRHVLDDLEASLSRPVRFFELDVTRDDVEALKPGDVALLENLRFDPREEQNDPDFAAHLASLGDIYVDDAFSCAHRAHASTEAIAHLLPSYAGRMMQAELRALHKALDQPRRPSVAVVGGAKVSTKIHILENLVGHVDTLILGGGMANTFLLSRGKEVGRSLCEPDLVETARAIEAAARNSGCEILLPSDLVVAGGLAAGVECQTVAAGDVPANKMALDIGPETLAAIEQVLARAGTVLWNGPLGAFEVEPFDIGTVKAAQLVAQNTRSHGLVSVGGGGDTVAALARAGVEHQFTYVSAAGGAFLEWLEGRTLPGIAALMRSAQRQASA